MSPPAPHATTLKPYASRASLHSNPTAVRLLQIMDRKKSNLCVSVDVTTAEEVLRIVRAVGESICMVKTHCDIINDFSPSFVQELSALSQELDFVIFEDRKFADIGNTVTLQYSSGTHRISSWADITNAHPLPGPGIISGLAKVGQPLGRGLLLLAEMSSKGNLATGEYTRTAMQMARDARREFVIGFIAMSRVDIPAGGKANGHGANGNGNANGAEHGAEAEEDWLIMTPGVGLAAKGDSLGQQYRTPREVVLESGCDVIIVGRGIYGGAGEAEWKSEAERYRAEGWKAYEERLSL